MAVRDGARRTIIGWRLVLPTVIEPSREKWDAAFTLNMQGKNAEARSAKGEVGIEMLETQLKLPKLYVYKGVAYAPMELPPAAARELLLGWE